MRVCVLTALILVSITATLAASNDNVSDGVASVDLASKVTAGYPLQTEQTEELRYDDLITREFAGKHTKVQNLLYEKSEPNELLHISKQTQQLQEEVATQRAAAEARQREEEAATQRAAAEAREREEEAATQRAAAEARQREEEAATQRAAAEARQREEEAATQRAAAEAREREEEAATQRAAAEARQREEEAAKQRAAAEARQREEEAATQRAAAEARQREEEAATQRAAAEAREREEEAATQRAAAEARQREEEAAKQRAAAEARQREEEAATQRAAAEAREREEEAATQRAAAEARQREEEAAKQRAAAEARQREEEVATQRAAAEARQREEEAATQRASAEAREREEEAATQRAAAEARQREEEAAKQRAAAEARQREEEAAKQRAAAEARQREEEAATQRAAAEARQREEEAAKQRAAAEARQREEEAATQRAAAEARQREEEAATQRAAAEARQREEEAKVLQQVKSIASLQSQLKEEMWILDDVMSNLGLTIGTLGEGSPDGLRIEHDLRSLVNQMAQLNNLWQVILERVQLIELSNQVTTPHETKSTLVKETADIEVFPQDDGERSAFVNNDDRVSTTVRETGRTDTPRNDSLFASHEADLSQAQPLHQARARMYDGHDPTAATAKEVTSVVNEVESSARASDYAESVDQESIYDAESIVQLNTVTGIAAALIYGVATILYFMFRFRQDVSANDNYIEKFASHETDTSLNLARPGVTKDDISQNPGSTLHSGTHGLPQPLPTQSVSSSATSTSNRPLPPPPPPFSFHTAKPHTGNYVPNTLPELVAPPRPTAVVEQQRRQLPQRQQHVLPDRQLTLAQHMQPPQPRMTTIPPAGRIAISPLAYDNHPSRSPIIEQSFEDRGIHATPPPSGPQACHNLAKSNLSGSPLGIPQKTISANDTIHTPSLTTSASFYNDALQSRGNCSASSNQYYGAVQPIVIDLNRNQTDDFEEIHNPILARWST